VNITEISILLTALEIQHAIQVPGLHELPKSTHKI